MECDAVVAAGRVEEAAAAASTLGTASPLDPLADLRSVEVVQVGCTAATRRMDGSNALQRRLHALLAQQLAECIEDDAIADTEEEVEGSGNDALGRDGEERLLACRMRVLVCWSAVARGGEEIVPADDADGAGMRGGGGHEAKHCVEEAPVAVEEGTASVDKVLQDLPPR